MKIIPIMKSEKATTSKCNYDRNKTFVDRGPGHESLQSVFDADHLLFWNNLSRLNNLLVVINISMFFLTGLVAKGYFYTFYSLACLGFVAVGEIIPTPWTRRLWYYAIYLTTELAAGYFLVASIVYWVRNGSG
jgi:hypothetical protein